VFGGFSATIKNEAFKKTLASVQQLL